MRGLLGRRELVARYGALDVPHQDQARMQTESQAEGVRPGSTRVDVAVGVAELQPTEPATATDGEWTVDHRAGKRLGRRVIVVVPAGRWRVAGGRPISRRRRVAGGRPVSGRRRVARRS